jgi:hypothetical protein
MVSWDTRLGSADMKQLQVGHDVLRWVGAISILIAAASGAHAQATKNGEPMVIAAANVEGYWAVKLKLRSGGGDDWPMLFVLHQDDDVIWGHIVITRSGFILTGALKGNEITLWFTTEFEGRDNTFEFKGEVKGDVMEGSADIHDQDARWSATRFKLAPERPQ